MGSAKERISMNILEVKQFLKPLRFVSCAVALAISTPAFGDEEKPGGNDPLEPLNRLTSGFNALLRNTIIDPAVDMYQFVTPDPLENVISNAASNLTEPLTIGSSLLQGDTENARIATQRFLINSTVGVAGLGDPATEMGLEQRREDLGQAMGANGVEPGPHLVLPILGPSNFRDAAGDILSGIASPMPLVGNAASGVVEYSNNQDTIKSVGANAIDRYVAEREAYEQNREYKVQNGDVAGPVFEEDKPKK
jgi:phospholipid-binding lipoprotein MlaA